MCEFCFAHGTGKKWFKFASHYAREMYYRKRSEAPVKKRGGSVEGQVAALALQTMEAKSLKPSKYPELLKKANRLTRETHSGQVLTLEDAETLIDLAHPIAFIACDCRRQLHSFIERDREKMTCLGLGIGMYRWEQFPARYVAGAEFVDDKEAKEWLRTWNKKGLVQTLMTFGMRRGAPYIGGLCNCSYGDCLSIRWRLDYGFKQLLKGERVARLHPQKCKGCFNCIIRCQFGAITADVRQERAHIDMSKCFGCGLCENTCPENAIELLDRQQFDVLKHPSEF